MNETEALQRLDEIERLAPDPTVDAGALEIMEALAETPDGLRLLVNRYSSTPSTNIAGYLALVLGKKSSESNAETAPLVFEFANGLKRNDYEGALISSLGAMNSQIGFGAGWGGTPRPPHSLFPFVKHCLNYTGKQNILVQFAAVDLIVTICWGHLLLIVFSVEEVEWIKARLKELSQTDNALLTHEIAQFEQCLSEEKQT